MIYFHIVEEYGFAEWVWAFPGTPEEAAIEWRSWRLDRDHSRRGTLHSVDLEHLAKFDLVPHCQGNGRNFCDDCARIEVRERTRDGWLPFPALTDTRQFAGVGHVHEIEDTYLEIFGVGRLDDRHLDCPDGCRTCAVCETHTRSTSAKDYSCVVCARPLCTACSGCHEVAFCDCHNVVDAVAQIDDESAPISSINE